MLADVESECGCRRSSADSPLATTRAFAFSPFEKRGYRGICFCCCLSGQIKSKSPSIPLLQSGDRHNWLLSDRGISRMHVLYYAPGSASLVVHWLLLDLGVPYELRPIDTAARQQKSAEYLALNPNGVVPTL